MKITKEGASPSTVYVGKCEECGCEFECTRDETQVGLDRYALCPCCDELVTVLRKEATNG